MDAQQLRHKHRSLGWHPFTLKYYLEGPPIAASAFISSEESHSEPVLQR